MLAGQMASRTNALRYPDHLCLVIRPTAQIISKAPLSRIKKLCSGIQGGMSQRKASGLIRCRNPLAENKAMRRIRRTPLSEEDFMPRDLAPQGILSRP